MSKRFLPWDVDQVSLFPPSVLDYVPLSHPAHFVRDLVRDELDLEAVYASYEDARGAPAFHAAMMTALLLYGYTQGIYSSRRISPSLRGAARFPRGDGKLEARFSDDRGVS